MYLTNLALIDYRSYTKAVVEFGAGVTCLVGRNGSGKTNLVEAIGYLATLSSHRAPSDIALVRQGASAAVIQARVMTANRPRVLEVEIYAGRANRARIDRMAARPVEVTGIVRSVLFAPEDLTLIRDEPSVRRRFLDEVMIQRRPKMAQVRADYEKVVRQRGALLKSLSASKRRGFGADEGALDVWDVQLANLGGKIMAERAAIVTSMRPHCAHYYERIAGAGKVARLDYQANADSGRWTLPSALDVCESPAVEEEIAAHERELASAEVCEQLLMERLSQSREKEIERGVNLVGPHRDDLRISLASFPARGYASHGESWSLALALRLASWQHLTVSGDTPILILDDVFAELDALRREKLGEIVGEAEQVFVTAAVEADLPAALAGTIYRVEPGSIVKDDEAAGASEANLAPREVPTEAASDGEEVDDE